MIDREFKVNLRACRGERNEVSGEAELEDSEGALAENGHAQHQEDQMGHLAHEVQQNEETE